MEGGGEKRGEWTGPLLGIFLISFSTLAFEVYLLRLFSVREWYHFASMVVSVALFGISLSGTALALRPLVSRESFGGIAAGGALGFSLSAMIAVVAGNHLHFHPFWGTFGAGDVASLLGWYLLCGAPFFFSGLVVGSALAAFPFRAGTIYGTNLIGSGAGCAAILLLIPLYRERTPAVLAALGMLGGMPFAGRWRWGLGVGGVVMAFLPMPGPALSPYKALSRFLTYEDAEVVRTEWGAASQVDVVRSSQVRLAPGRSLMGKDPLPRQVGILIDGDGMTAVTPCGEGVPGFVRELPSVIPYRMRVGGRALVLEAGGGLGVWTALGGGMEEVTAQESNPLVAEIVSGEDVYRREGVRLVAEDARGFLRRDGGMYDVVEISLRDGIDASTTGLSGLGEDYLYTVEAMGRIHDRLDDGGILSVTGWLTLPVREPVKLFGTVREAWIRRGEESVIDGLVLYRSLETYTLLARRGPFEKSERDAIRKMVDGMGFDLVYLGDLDASEVNRHLRFDRPYFAEGIRDFLADPDGAVGSYIFDIRPPTDDRPFYRQYLRWRSLGRLTEETGMRFEPLFEASLLHAGVLGVALILSLACLMIPVTVLHLRRGSGGVLRVSAYFFALGAGFMLVEIPGIQSSILTVGRPAHAFSVVVGSVLVFSGIGSLLSHRLGGRRAMAVLVGVVLATAFLLPLWRDHLAMSLPLRLGITAAAFAPVALLMGIPFPTGVRALAGDRARLVPWAWAANGAASVMGSVAATLLAISIGMRWVMIIGAGCYLVAVILFPRKG